MTYVLLPVTQETYDEIAAEVKARGQADRIGSVKVDLRDVILVVAPEEKIAPVSSRTRKP